MESLEKKYFDSYVVVSVQLFRATINEAQEFRNSIEQDMEMGYNNFIIDLSSCEYLDSTFVGAMIIIYKKLKEQGGNHLLVKSGKFTEMIFLITETLTRFNIFHSIEEAVSYMFTPNFSIEPVLSGEDQYIKMHKTI